MKPALSKSPNLIFLFADQLRAMSLPVYGEDQIRTPNIDRLSAEGTVMDSMIAGCPVCTPSRAMLLTGRHPQTTGHLMNSVKTRHSEISIADAFSNGGYRCGWVGKWHLHTGVWPALNRRPMQPDWVPHGRDRLGFEFWRAYNQHMVYFDGYVQSGDWEYSQWTGYETDGLFEYGREFIDMRDDRPFALFLSPHQPHFTPDKFAPDEYYDRLPDRLRLPENVPADMLEECLTMYRHYLAMILALDDMLGKVFAHLETTGLLEDTLIVFASDHGTQGGSQGISPWMKKMPYEASIRVPMILRLPGRVPPGRRVADLMAMVDVFPTLCGLLDVPVPRSVEGMDLSAAVMGQPGPRRDDVFLMNFSAAYDALETGAEWRGLRTGSATYVEWLDGRAELYDLRTDPDQTTNLADAPEAAELREVLRRRLAVEMARRGDRLQPVTACHYWYDAQRRVVRNGYGELSHPESTPDWSLLSAAPG